MAETIIVPRRRQDWFKTNGDLTLRALRFFESLTDVTNTTSIVIDGNDEGLAILEARLLSQSAIATQQQQNSEVNDRIEAVEIDLLARPHSSAINAQQQQSAALDDRLEVVEIDLSTRPRVADLYRANQRIDELIDELVTQLEKLNFGSEAQQQTVCLQMETLKQMKLLNIRTEEAFNTRLDEEDIE